MNNLWRVCGTVVLALFFWFTATESVPAANASSDQSHEKNHGMAMEGKGHGAHTPEAHTTVKHQDHEMVMHPAGDSETAHDHAAMEAAKATMKPEEGTVEVIEKLGEHLPPDIEVVDSSGKRHALESLLGKPTILVLIYYYCPTACTVIQGNLASALNDVPSKLGEDYQVISISFNPEERTKQARIAKTNYTKILKPPPAPDAWRFFTADAEDIQRITEAVGFHYKQMGPHSFLHPNVITVVSGEGKIIRYLYGTDYLPFDVGMALSEALKGTPGVSIKKILSYCFEYDPSQNRYAFKLIQFSGIVTLFLVGGFIFFLVRKRSS